MAEWYVRLSVLRWMIVYMHIWIDNSGYQNGSNCKRQEGAYTLFITVSSLVIETFTPIFLMNIFSLFTLKNLHRFHQRRTRIMPIMYYPPKTITIPKTMNNVIVESKQNLPSGKKDQR